MATGTTGAPGNIPYPRGSDQYALTSDLAVMASQTNLALADAATNIAEVAEGRSPVGHTHQIGNVTGLQTALDGKAPSEHTHPMGDVTGLQAALDTKMPKAPLSVGTTHLDTLLEPCEFQQPVDTDASVANGYPDVRPSSPGSGWAGVGSVKQWGTAGQLIQNYQPRIGPAWVRERYTSWGPWRTSVTAEHTHTWGEVTDKPAAFTPTSHTHSIGNVDGLQAALDAAGTETDWTAAIAALNTAAT